MIRVYKHAIFSNFSIVLLLCKFIVVLHNSEKRRITIHMMRVEFFMNKIPIKRFLPHEKIKQGDNCIPSPRI